MANLTDTKVHGNLQVSRTVSASGAGGFASSTYEVNTRNPIWRFGNADTYGLSYFQGSAGTGGGDSINFHFGTATAAGSKFNFKANGELQASSFNAGSLRSLKNDIEPFSKNALDIINTVDVSSFTYKADEEKNYHVGFIADDTHEILAGKNHDHMDMGNSIGVLIKAVQELSQKNEELEERINKLENSFFRRVLNKLHRSK